MNRSEIRRPAWHSRTQEAEAPAESRRDELSAQRELRPRVIACHIVKYGNTQAANVSTRKKPDISVIVVRIGPDASAGSCPSPRKMSGIDPPKHTATSVLTASAAATTAPSTQFPFQRYPTTPKSTPSTTPLMIPTA